MIDINKLKRGDIIVFYDEMFEFGEIITKYEIPSSFRFHPLGGPYNIRKSSIGFINEKGMTNNTYRNPTKKEIKLAKLKKIK